MVNQQNQMLRGGQTNSLMNKPGMGVTQPIVLGSSATTNATNTNTTTTTINNNNTNNNSVNSTNMQRGSNPTITALGGVNPVSNSALNKPAMRQMTNSGAASPANRMSTQSPVNTTKSNNKKHSFRILGKPVFSSYSCDACTYAI